MHTDLKVGKYWGEMGVDYWSATDWKEQQDEYEVSIIFVSLYMIIYNMQF